MFTSPYQTTPCAEYDLAGIVQEVMEEVIGDALMSENGPVSVLCPASPGVPIFTQPLTKMEFGDRKNAPLIVVDGRASMRINKGGSPQYVVTDVTNYDMQMLRARLQLLWQREDYAKLELLRVGDLPAISFINWISKTISSKLDLDMISQIPLNVVVGYYYACLFYTEKEFDDNSKLKTAQQVARWTRVPAENVLKYTDQLAYIANIDGMIKSIQQVVPSARTEQINRKLIYALLGGSWFGGPASRETVCVALEHPPTWLAYVYSGVTQRGYRSTTIGKVATMAVRGGNDNEFSKNLAYQLKEFRDN